MLVFRQLPSNQNEFLPVLVLQNESTPVPSSSFDRLMYAAINPSVSSHPSRQYILRSNPPFFIGHDLFQHLPCPYTFTVGAIADGPQTLLQSDSIRLLEDLHPIAKHVARTRVMTRLKKSAQKSEEVPRESNTRLSVKAITRGDIVVDVDRAIEISRSSMELHIDDEIERVKKIAEHFILWCMNE